MEQAPIPQRQMESLIPGPNMEKLPPQPGPELMNLVMNDVQVVPVETGPVKPLGLGLAGSASGNKVAETHAESSADAQMSEAIRDYVRNDPRAQGGRKYGRPNPNNRIPIATWEHSEPVRATGTVKPPGLGLRHRDPRGPASGNKKVETPTEGSTEDGVRELIRDYYRNDPRVKGDTRFRRSTANPNNRIVIARWEHAEPPRREPPQGRQPLGLG